MGNNPSLFGGSANVTALRGTGSSVLVGVGTTGDVANRIELDADGIIRFGPGSGAVDTPGLERVSAGLLEVPGGLNVAGALQQVGSGGGISLTNGPVDVTTAGFGIDVKEGANCKQGIAVLVAGTVTVANTSVTANSRIFLTTQTPGGTAGFLVVSARVAGTSFTILSSNAADTSTVAYEIFEPG